MGYAAAGSWIASAAGGDGTPSSLTLAAGVWTLRAFGLTATAAAVGPLPECPPASGWSDGNITVAPGDCAAIGVCCNATLAASLPATYTLYYTLAACDDTPSNPSLLGTHSVVVTHDANTRLPNCDYHTADGAFHVSLIDTNAGTGLPPSGVCHWTVEIAPDDIGYPFAQPDNVFYKGLAGAGAGAVGNYPINGPLNGPPCGRRGGVPGGSLYVSAAGVGP